jgi:ring-1,2-phenylacetyl-CoA epoxidase subunit PaaE
MAKPKFYPLKVAELTKETSDCTSIAFDVPQALRDTFTYKQGQYLTLRTDINGEDIRRSYSLCSSPLDKKWRVAVKQLEGGRFSTFANQELQAGDTLDVMPPMGNFFTELRPEHAKTYVAFAAGSGITPIISIIKTTLRTEPDSEFILFFSNRNVHYIIFKEEIEGLKNRFLSRFQVYHFLTREMQDIPLFNGRFDKEKLNDIFSRLIQPDSVDEYFICGPEEMILCIKDDLAGRDIDSKKVHFELFGTSDKKQKKEKKKALITSDQVSQVTIKD